MQDWHSPPINVFMAPSLIELMLDSTQSAKFYRVVKYGGGPTSMETCPPHPPKKLVHPQPNICSPRFEIFSLRFAGIHLLFMFSEACSYEQLHSNCNVHI